MADAVDAETAETVVAAVHLRTVEQTGTLAGVES